MNAHELDSTSAQAKQSNLKNKTKTKNITDFNKIYYFGLFEVIRTKCDE